MTSIQSYFENALPKTLMFIGDTGCGKHTVAKYIAEKFDLAFVEITENITSTELIDYQLSTIKTLYLIDLNKFNKKQQNQFLKFVEEPSTSVFIILIANSETAVLDTLLNRSIKHYFEAYTKEQVEQINNTNINEQAFKIFKTPGKLLNLTEQSFKELLELSEKLVHKIAPAAYANTLSIVTKINYKDLYSKIDFNLFLDAVEHVAFEDFKVTNSRQSFIIFKVTSQFNYYKLQNSLIKETLMVNYLTTLWEACRNDIDRA